MEGSVSVPKCVKPLWHLQITWVSNTKTRYNGCLGKHLIINVSTTNWKVPDPPLPLCLDKNAARLQGKIILCIKYVCIYYITQCKLAYISYNIHIFIWTILAGIVERRISPASLWQKKNCDIIDASMQERDLVSELL